ncbi:MAG: hypothetical protein K6A63_04865 [Acholeplasmatales bacterium]|nr:hypothetical protein [Acholeplasmatales bacterium]
MQSKAARLEASSKKQIKRREMILGVNLWKTILIIIAPLALYQLFNSIYSLIDAAICAQISTDAQANVVAINQIKSTISAFGGGLAAGGAVLVSRYFGAGEVKHARYASSNMFFMSLILSAILCLVLIPLAYPLLKLCQVPGAGNPDVVMFFILQLIELIFVSLNSVFIGLEKAKGNSKIIMFLNFMVLFIKIGLTCLFVFGIGGQFKNIIYVEVSTIVAQAALTVVGLFILFGKNNILRLSFRMILPKKMYVVPILKLSIPIFLGKFVMSLGKVIVNAMCGYYWNAVTDSLIVGTLGVSNNMCGLITSPTNSFEEGESTIVSQNLGNRNMKRAIKAFVYTIISVTIVSVIGYTLMRFVFINQLVELFTSADAKSEAYKQMVKDIFVWDSLSIPALGVTAGVLGLLYGFGQTKLSTVLNLSRIGSRIIILLIFHAVNPNMSATLCAGLSMGISNTIILLLSTTFLVIFLLRIKKNGYKGMYMSDPEPEMSVLKIDEAIDDDKSNQDSTSNNTEENSNEYKLNDDEYVVIGEPNKASE